MAGLALVAALGSTWVLNRLAGQRLSGAAGSGEGEGRKVSSLLSFQRWIRNRRLYLFLGAFALGALTQTLRPLPGTDSDFNHVMTGLLILPVGVTIGFGYLRYRSPFLAYQLELLALWALWITGWLAVARGVWSDDTMSLPVFLWGYSVVFGGLVWWSRRRIARPAEPG